MKHGFFEPTVSVVVRWFQAGAGDTKEFDRKDFEVRLRSPLVRFMRQMSSKVKSIVIVSNADPRYGLGELPDGSGDTPTVRAIKQTFKKEMANGFISVLTDSEWGNNAGTAHALNVGWSHALQEKQPEFILAWNPELQMEDAILTQMLVHYERHQLAVVGVYRQRYWSLYQWQLPQNTACLYPAELLTRMDGFDIRCDGNTKEKILVPAHGEVTLAGMEDFDFLLRYWKKHDRLPRWGMVGRARPFLWDVDFEPNSTRALMLREKIARQPLVLERWARHHFPTIDYRQLMDAFFAHRHED